ncbi:MAG: thioredoxin domain-containing protein [Dehalococcoidia bacterium]
MTNPTEAPRNRLALESSPYLLQHAANPVDWYPWGDEAFERARIEDRPVLLSVGYSSCHWCHVMAHESFEDPAIAEVMNDHFVSIKVDREERPDIDAVYMTATQALTGQGGWPMTVFLTPDREPFFAGTYFPPTDAYGRPGFRTLLENIARAWSEDRARVLESATHITERLREATEARTAAAMPVPPSAANEAVERLRATFDATWGGFGGAPKFPAATTLEFLMMHHARLAPSGDPSALSMVVDTLHHMARGGMYDQLGGGFARYSVDARWLVPHFEKMLYDNAQLARVYLHASLLAPEERDRQLFGNVSRETLDYLLREMRDSLGNSKGGFHSAQDADSEGVEGKYFTWTPAQVAEVLRDANLEADLPLVLDAYAITEAGNFADPHHPELGRTNVLSAPRSLEDLALAHGLDVPTVAARLEAARGALLQARERRVRPGLDDKVLTSWNGLALAAFAEAARVLDEPRYLEAALETAAFLRGTMLRDGRLLHAYRGDSGSGANGGTAKVEGLLEDYAYLGLALVELYRATGDLAHLEWAVELFEAVLERFSDRDRGGFFDSPADGEALLLRQKSTFDSPTPSGNGAAALLALTLSRYYDRPSWERVAEEALRSVAAMLPRASSGFGTLLQVLELQLAPRQEVAILGTPEARAPLEREVARRYLPHLVLAPAEAAGGIPVLEDRAPLDGAAATAFVCEQMVCQLPVTTVEALAAQLDAARPV